MEKANIDPPAIVKYRQYLRKYGLTIDDDILDIESLAKFLGKR